MDERTSFSSRVVLRAFWLSIALAFGVALLVYVKYVRWAPVAATHVPASMPIAVRLQVEQAVVYEPFRKHLLPLLEAGKSGPETRLKHVERKTTLELGVDVREVVFGVGARDEWVLALGGLFRRDGVVAGVGRLLTEEKRSFQLASDPDRVRFVSGVALGVADDGTLLAAGSDALLLSALEPHAPGPFEAVPSGVATLVARFPGGLDLGQGRRIRSLRGRILPAEDFDFLFEFEVSGPGWEQPLAVLGAIEQEPARRWIGLSGLARGRAESLGAGRFQVVGTWTRAEFESLVAELAAEVRRRAGLPL